MKIRLIESEVVKKYPDTKRLDFSKEFVVEDLYSEGRISVKIDDDSEIGFSLLVLEKDSYTWVDGEWEKIDMYDKTKRIGSTIIEVNTDNDNVLCILDIMYKCEKRSILRVLGMNYGILIPIDVSDKIRNIIDEVEM